MKEELAKIVQDALSEAKKAGTLAEMNDVRVKFLGKNGAMTAVLKQLNNVPKEQKPEMGKLVNSAREQIESAFIGKEKALREAELNARLMSERIDVTLPSSDKRTIGALHPLTIIKNEIIDIFSTFGFSVAEGPEVELDYYNFQLLNIPKDHPARDMADTFYVDEKTVLRTHTSPMQARIMTTTPPPIRVLVPGKVYRSDDDASHSPIFNQIEGLCVDKKITLGDLKGVLTAFVEKLFSRNTKVRFRPSYFPFTEPSVEVDVTCTICGGKGCRVCKGTGFLEILGSGIVNPKVLELCGLDPSEYSGFAFGFGIERIAMLKFGIPHIKMLYENDVRFLKQFR